MPSTIKLLDSSRYFVIRIQEGGGKLDTRVCNAFYYVKLLDSSRYFVNRIQEGGGKLDTRVCNAFYYVKLLDSSRYFVIRILTRVDLDSHKRSEG